MQPNTNTQSKKQDPLAALRATQYGAPTFVDPSGKKLPDNKQPQQDERKRTIDPVIEAAKWKNRYDIAKTYQIPMFQKWSKWYDDMYAHIQDNNAMAMWRSKVYMPIIASKIWDMISRFIQYRPGWEVSVRTLPINTLSKEAFDQYVQEMNMRVEKVRMKLEYDYDNPLMEDSIPDELLGVMLDAAVTGQGIGRVPYLTRKTDYKNYVQDGQQVNFSKVENKQAVEGYNSFSGVNIFNFFIKPGARTMQRSPWIIVTDQVPLYELQKDPKYDKTVLEKLKASKISNEFAQYEASRNRLATTADTSNVDTTTQMCQIYECWDKEWNECIIYGLGTDGWVELHRSTNIYWHQKYPFVTFYVRKKPYQFWGESMFENTESLQNAINDIFNHFMDGHNMADGMIAIEEGSVVEPYTVEPGGEIRYRGEMPKQFKFPQPDAANMSTAINLINGSIENATISQYASGVPNSATDQTQGTATGVTRMMEAAAEKVGFMRANFRRSWREVGQMWLSNSQQFMTSDAVYEQTVKGDKTYEIIKPTDIIGIFGIKIDDGSFEPISKDETKQNKLEFVDKVLQLQKASVEQADRNQDTSQAINLDFAEMMTDVGDQYGESVARFIAKPTVVPPVQGMPQPPQSTPTDVPAAQPLVAPMSAEAAGAIPQQGDVSNVQPDGKTLPTSFPVRNVNALSPML